ncbi:hypothetical protein Godav_009549 [Gossypium davidsonii]|uniref:Uncharacterized protein n=2 Tax=Gossypium TaxID=3633 RepID=A0A7J8SE66_GOSDV|nr:hypothetical protein [Gossypium davidsonii]MBA0659731.1 hypothetical protein [Gossypium klotzschianum]
MKLLRRSSSKGGRSKPNEGCKRHPKHRQSPGVCSLCLVDKLSKLPSPPHCTSTIRTATKLADSNCSPSSSSSSSLSSPCSSASDSALYSSSSSPMHRYRFGKDRGAGSSFSLLWFSGKNLLTKSRSVAFVSRIENNGYDDKKKKKKINGGFLSKLIH